MGVSCCLHSMHPLTGYQCFSQVSGPGRQEGETGFRSPGSQSLPRILMSQSRFLMVGACLPPLGPRAGVQLGLREPRPPTVSPAL